MREKLKKLTKYYGLYDYWKEEVLNLAKKDENFDVLDLDGTLFSVKDRVESNDIFQKNRGEQWNLLITNELGLKKVVKEYYKNKKYPTELLHSVNKEKSLILTKGIREYQVEKAKYMGIDDYTMLVTTTAEEKIISLIRFVIFDLKYIPSSITVYEDRPQFFVEYRDLIEDVLWIELTIKKVTMDGNNNPVHIEVI